MIGLDTVGNVYEVLFNALFELILINLDIVLK